jgi:hypothetical protein
MNKILNVKCERFTQIFLQRNLGFLQRKLLHLPTLIAVLKGGDA